jgi:DNA polymerase I-like protein with 3'-5' exonuclease and polymerase domains
MFFQAITVENKRKIFADGKFFDEIQKNHTKTWSFADYGSDNVEYAQFICNGKTIDEVCPEMLQDSWEASKEKIKSHCRACVESRIDITNGKFYNFVPQSVLEEYLTIKNKITEHAFKTYDKPENYEFLKELQNVLSSIEKNRLKVSLDPLRSKRHDFRVNQFYNKIQRTQPFIRYNLFGTKTGRLTTKKGSFPILTMDKDYRKILTPQNDIFVELDYNAAELRTLLSLSEVTQPKDDIHDWNIENVFRESMSRDEAKKKVFSWLYNPAATDDKLGSVYNRNFVLGKYWDGTRIINPFGRKMDADAKHALNYIIQSTTSDLFLKRVLELYKILENKKTFISFLIHDSVVIDLDKSERHLIQEMADVFSKTDFSKFLVNIKAGKNYGDMKDICKI